MRESPSESPSGGTVKRAALIALSLLAGGAASACGSGAPAAGGAFRVVVAPLALPGITDAVYRVTVTNGPSRAGAIVWQEVISSAEHGDGEGAISYVGPCDAGVTTESSVTIELLDLKSGSPPAPLDDDTYVNPCGELLGWSSQAERDASGESDLEDQQGRCTINRTCVDGADVRVDFDLTVMRDAQQLPTVVAVALDECACSARATCRQDFLHDGEAQTSATVIVSFACTSGENEQTFLYASDLVLTCAGPAPSDPTDDTTTIIPATASPGQHGPIGGGVYQSAVYIGDEQLTSNGQPLEKCYWMRAVGIERTNLSGPCTLSGVATASDTPLVPETLLDEGAAFPIITWSVLVIDADGALCEEQPLDAESSGVQSAYLDASDPDAAAVVVSLLPPSSPSSSDGQGVGYACGARSIRCAAGPMPSSGETADIVTATQLDSETIHVTTGGQSATIQLSGALEGYTLGTTCHRDACCSSD